MVVGVMHNTKRQRGTKQKAMALGVATIVRPDPPPVAALVACALAAVDQRCVADCMLVLCHQFADALLVIPKTLAVNAAQDATELVANLCNYHHTAQQVESKESYKYYGLDLTSGKVRCNLTAGVLEPAMSKVKSLRFATEAAITILRIDDRIKINKEEQDPRAMRGH